jgi:hypothetical protein
MGIQLRGTEMQKLSDQEVAAVIFPQRKILETH